MPTPVAAARTVKLTPGIDIYTSSPYLFSNFNLIILLINMETFKSLKYATLDVFTQKRFQGNQLAVVHLPSECSISQETKQAIAREFNFSETVFLHETSGGSSDRPIDIFTPSQELPFAGHPVVGTICYMCEAANPPTSQVSLKSKAGRLSGIYDPLERVAEVDIPQNVHLHSKRARNQDFLECQTGFPIGKDVPPDHPILSVVKGMSFILVNVTNLELLAALQASLQKINYQDINLDPDWMPSFLAPYYYAIVDKDRDVTRVRSRLLEPTIGEDPCTGSAASSLASYLSLQDGEAGKTYKYLIEQGVEMGRAGQIHVKVTLDSSGKTVQKIVLAGSSVLVATGNLLIP